ncbi:MAG TPA: phenylalanine--tRNA ligase subunit beta [Candidatus Aminicenantes bacterium]|nr:phenylalanine--tRNA ligase subunit beta [Candidatus Aminicenantes bacterium]
MRISIDWLSDFIDLDLSVEELIQMLNNIGLVVEDRQEVEGDTILEIETYANRPDTLGHLGIARELSAALQKPLKEQHWPLVEITEKTSDLIDVQVFVEDLCPRYCGLIVRDVAVGPSPEWLQKRLRAVGVKSINNVVDVTNYVLYATAQPVHAFDLAKLAGSKIIVRQAKKGELLRTLDGTDLILSPENMVIADEQKPVALAGIVGGENSAVTSETKDVFIECAYFDPLSVRQTAKKLGIQTDASYRFERGADISFPPQAAWMVASFLSEFKGKVTKGLIDVYPSPVKRRTLILRHHRIQELLGVDISSETIEKTFTALEFQVSQAQPGSWKILAPYHRVDIEREADLIEEVARFYGYDRIPALFPPLRQLEPPPSPLKKLIQKIRQTLFHYGYNEVLNFSFASEEEISLFSHHLRPVSLRNPVSSRAALMRTTLLSGLITNIIYNLNHGVEGVHLFEVGKIYFWKNELPCEQLTLGLVSTGLISEKQWSTPQESGDFFRLKGAVETLFSMLRYEPLSFAAQDHPWCEPGLALNVKYKGESVGFLGQLRADMATKYGLQQEVWIAEFNLGHLLSKQPQPFTLRHLIKYPVVIRDVSFLADKDLRYSSVQEYLQKREIPWLERFELYDRFTGSTIPPGKVSLSFRFVFRHAERTLEAEEVDSLMERVIKALIMEFNFQLREGGKIDK